MDTRFLPAKTAEEDPHNVITVAPPLGSWNSQLAEKFHGEAAASIALSTWILFTNIVLMMAILRSDRLRKVSFNLHVCNLCFVNLLMGSIVMPLYGHFFLVGNWVLGDNVCRVWLVSDLMVCTVTVLVVCMMIFDRFVLFSCAESAEGGCKFVFTAVIILTPWVLGCAFVIPVYLMGEMGNGVDSNRKVCFLSMDAPHTVIYILGGYAVPSVATFGLLVATSLTWCVRRDELRSLEWSEEREHKGWQVLLSWLIIFSVIFMWLPFNTLHLLSYILDKTWPLDYINAVMWLAYANPALTPLLWMIKPRLRKCVMALLCCCCRGTRGGHRASSYHGDDTRTVMMEFHEKM